jgi:hypothetical protein
MRTLHTTWTQAVVVLTVLVASALTLAATAQAAGYYGRSARSVATEIGCKNFHSTFTGGGGTTLGSGVCWLKGRRVNVLTYKSTFQQRVWNGIARGGFGPRFYWATCPGANIVARNGNRPAARVGAQALPGRIMHG